MLYGSFPDNFLSKEIVEIQSFWNFNINDMHNHYEGSNIVPKIQIKKLLSHSQKSHTCHGTHIHQHAGKGTPG